MICLLGILIGFYGYLFPGNIILMILELYHTQRTKLLLFSILLVLVFESLYCSLSLLFLGSISSESLVFKTLEFLSFFLIAAFGIWMIFEKRKEQIKTQKNTIFRGMFSIILHPQQIPFWIIMGLVLNKITPIYAANQSFFLFVLFNAIGTFLALLFYMLSSAGIFHFLKSNGLQLNKIMGTLYIGLALYNLISNA